jgi:hypothetical protein
LPETNVFLCMGPMPGSVYHALMGGYLLEIVSNTVSASVTTATARCCSVCAVRPAQILMHYWTHGKIDRSDSDELTRPQSGYQLKLGGAKWLTRTY